MKRLIIVYNPRSSRFSEIEREVILPARKLKGWMVLKFEVKKGNVEADAAELTKVIRKGDLILSAGGDGTASMVMNAILWSGKLATMGVMGLGNFNDFYTTTGELKFSQIVKKFEEGKVETLYPLRVEVNGELFRYAGMYVTVGMMAEATGVFDQKRTRKRLSRARNRMSFAAGRLFKWYMKNKWRKDFLPEGAEVNGEALLKNTTDYVAVNGESLAGIVPAEGWTGESEKFWSGTLKGRSFFRLFVKFVKAVEEELPGRETTGDVIKFKNPYNIYIHVEGENEKMEGVGEISVKKTGEYVRVISA